jgi:hypothetical protein
MKPALRIIARNDADIQSMPDDWGVKIEVAADERRRQIEAARTGAKTDA